MVVLQTATVSDAAAFSLSRGVPGTVAARAALSSKTVGARMFHTVIQSDWTSTIVGWIFRQTSLANASTLLSYGVALAKEGMTYCTPHRNLM